MAIIDGFKWLIIPTGMSLNAGSASIKIWTTYQLRAIFTPAGATNQHVTWASSNNSIATVDSTGKVTPVSAGSCTITATSEYGWYTSTCSCTITVVHTTGVSLNENEIEISEWEMFQLEATVTPSDTSYPEVTWSSSNTSVATVSQSWLVTYVGDGECTITVTTTDWWYTASCSISTWVPKEYQKVEYIESTGSQYIDTWFQYTQTTWEVKIKFASTALWWYYHTYRLGGAYNWSNRSFIMYNAYNPAYIWLWSWDYSTWITETSNTIYEVDTLITTPWTCVYTLNWNTATISYWWSIATSRNYFIFCNNENWSPWNYWKFKLYYYQLYEWWELVRDFVPCYRKSDWVIWLWDKVWKQFYTNSGSWTFTKWNDCDIKLRDFNELEYIESTGSQYIDTWVKANNTISTEIVIWPNMNYISEYAIFGDAWSANALFLMEYNSKYRLHNGWSYWDFANVTDAKTTITTNNAWLTINWTSYTLAAWSSYSSNNIWIFATWDWSNTGKRWYFKLYEYKIYSNWDLIRDFMPAQRKSNWTIWIIDKVNKVFYVNNWTWTFTAGPKIWITLSDNSLALTEAWQTYQLTASANPSSIWDQWYQWRSSDTTIATVNSSWLVTCVTPGECTITCTSNIGWYVDTCKVSETAQEVKSFNFKNMSQSDLTNAWFEISAYNNWTFGISSSAWIYSGHDWQVEVYYPIDLSSVKTISISTVFYWTTGSRCWWPSFWLCKTKVNWVEVSDVPLWWNLLFQSNSGYDYQWLWVWWTRKAQNQNHISSWEYTCTLSLDFDTGVAVRDTWAYTLTYTLTSAEIENVRLSQYIWLQVNYNWSRQFQMWSSEWTITF